MFVFPVIAYAEIHYRFRYFLSYLKQPVPEIIFDAPYRIEPNVSLPILLLIKDAHLYPVHIQKVTLTIIKDGKILEIEQHELTESADINVPYWWKIFEIDCRQKLSDIYGLIEIQVHCEYVCNGKSKQMSTNNLRTASKKNLRIYRSSDPLPSLTGWFPGDVHTHSNYTEDQVEFGIPLKAALPLSEAIGLRYFCATDHSYDMDDMIGDYLHNDPKLEKWALFQKEIQDINSSGMQTTVIRGEEVSCRNSRGNNVHFLLWGNRQFYHGSGDGGEKWFYTNSENSIEEVLNNLESDVVAYASHPFEKVPFLQRLLLRRDSWHDKDIRQNGLHGLQILNGELQEAFYTGLQRWVSLLLEGRKIFIAAGNDAHGNFNRFVQIGIPFVKIVEKESQLFGQMKTYVCAIGQSEKEILNALQKGRSMITNGPVVMCEAEDENHNIAGIGEIYSGDKCIMKLTGLSTKEFGMFSEVSIIAGIVGKSELIINKYTFEKPTFDFQLSSEWQDMKAFSYIRVEAKTEHCIGTENFGFCYTNPIWISC